MNTTKQIKRLLIANRGEIAVRVIHTCRLMGITSVAAYSDHDKTLPYVLQADEAYHLPGTTVGETYLNIDALMALCKTHHIDAVHPGYGFLSENATFAQRCQDEGIVFVGPSPQVIESMGDKIIAKTLMQKAGVPVVPGWSGDAATPISVLQTEANSIGYPILVKAAAGGGGKGMRRVESHDTLVSAIETAQREAQNAFGDSRIFLEKYVEDPRHVEFQIFGDTHGNVIHLFERECSIQRRHQKIIEETPSPFLDDTLRNQMADAAVKAAQALNYTNAGTVEFIVDKHKKFYFLEVNTRLQVEHPVTEGVTGLDLVRLQIMIANGKPLTVAQSDVTQRGHALECRVYAEDPDNNFLPSTGILAVYAPPTGPNIRVDSGFRQGDEVTVFYDPMLAKLITTGSNRTEALETMLAALNRFAVLGVKTNIDFCRQIMTHPQFVSGDFTTHFLQEHPIEANHPEASDTIQALAAAILATSSKTTPTTGPSESGSSQTPWGQIGHWRGTPNPPLIVPTESKEVVTV